MTTLCIFYQIYSLYLFLMNFYFFVSIFVKLFYLIIIYTYVYYGGCLHIEIYYDSTGREEIIDFVPLLLPTSLSEKCSLLNVTLYLVLIYLCIRTMSVHEIFMYSNFHSFLHRYFYVYKKKIISFIPKRSTCIYTFWLQIN